ncbi:hypothetical protein DFR58_101245 [Anaerobacterium chartisolvens]|uniref:Uncharacterized protein n=2 Tax=Anaerobacterium chartisolvens TaxID=1297424 RepID=A0A369BHK3_9FIRM|nr:hypothetical protein DFR58_101245 [Anaerobacterium chartisolvens]
MEKQLVNNRNICVERLTQASLLFVVFISDVLYSSRHNRLYYDSIIYQIRYLCLRRNAMNNFNDKIKRAEINMRLSEFEIPPMQDALIVGKRAPIGPEAARRMVDILSPEQYEIVEIEHPVIEAVVIRKSLTSMISKDRLVQLILDEGGKVANESTIIKAQLNIVLHVSTSIEL